MEDLKLGMPIFVTSTSGKDFLLDIVLTTLENATKRSSSDHIEIEMGKGLWGACPTRRRSAVFINADEVKTYAVTELADVTYITKGEEPLYVVNFNNNNNHLSLVEYSFKERVTSLRDGTFTEYGNGYSTLRVRDELPKYAFYSISDAIEYFANKSKEFLD